MCREQEQGDNFYVIESGIFAACIKEKRVFVYEGKGAFGELALMYNCPRAATVQVRATQGLGLCPVGMHQFLPSTT